MKNVILISISAVLLSLNFIDVDINEVLPYDQKEQYNPGMSYIKTLDMLEKHIDSTVASRSISRDSVAYVTTISDAILQRFYHGFSHFTLKENWIAAFAERIIGYGLASKVKPDDIMRHPFAACSQQAMVMMEILKRKGLSYRSVGFPHHFALEVLINGNWYYFDPNMEPSISNEQRLENYWGARADNLKQYYDTARFRDLDWKFGKDLKVTHGNINQKYATNAKLFQTVTGVASKILWIFPLIFVFYPRKKKK
ncbi:MAG: hypothetical protein IPI66_10395 [Chitinophagaceae bacterium]|nr:hypothetical protein [Chitinophagaceae bacterium]MBL0055286.1 hypothetical protein [Chitinophagaceae bacterium]